MTNEENPYKSPSAGEDDFESAAVPSGCWRDGERLIVTRDAQLPQLCVKCGRPGRRGGVRRVNCRPKTRGDNIMRGVLLGGAVCIALLFMWPLSVDISYTAIPIAGAVIGAMGYAYMRQTPSEKLDLTFSVCPYHQRLQYVSWILEFGLAAAALILADRGGIFIVMIMILVGQIGFRPKGERYGSTKHYFAIRGCGMPYLQTLPTITERECT